MKLLKSAFVLQSSAAVALFVAGVVAGYFWACETAYQETMAHQLGAVEHARREAEYWRSETDRLLHQLAQSEQVKQD